TARHLALAQRDHVVAVRDLFPDRLLVVEAFAALVDIAELHAVADPQLALVRLFGAGEQAEKRVLPAPFGPMMPTMPPGGSLKLRLSISRRSPNPLVRPSASITTLPRRGPGGMVIDT